VDVLLDVVLYLATGAVVYVAAYGAAVVYAVVVLLCVYAGCVPVLVLVPRATVCCCPLVSYWRLSLFWNVKLYSSDVPAGSVTVATYADPAAVDVICM
jgi:hypothetical protein